MFSTCLDGDMCLPENVAKATTVSMTTQDYNCRYACYVPVTYCSYIDFCRGYIFTRSGASDRITSQLYVCGVITSSCVMWRGVVLNTELLDELGEYYGVMAVVKKLLSYQVEVLLLIRWHAHCQ